MMIRVLMLAYHDDIPLRIREVQIPDTEISPKTDETDILGLAYEYGQNENCRDPSITSTTCSVSVGDVILYPDGKYNMVLSLGFHEITHDEVKKHIALDRRDRSMAAYTLRE